MEACKIFLRSKLFYPSPAPKGGLKKKIVFFGFLKLFCGYLQSSLNFCSREAVNPFKSYKLLGLHENRLKIRRFALQEGDLWRFLPKIHEFWKFFIFEPFFHPLQKSEVGIIQIIIKSFGIWYCSFCHSFFNILKLYLNDLSDL